MEFSSHQCATVPASVNVSRFAGASGVEEVHLIVRPLEYASIERQLEWVHRAYDEALRSVGMDARTAVFRRFFCSDVHNQASVLGSMPYSRPGHPEHPCAVSWVGQPPVPPAKVAMWAYHVGDGRNELEKLQRDGWTTLVRGELAHHWAAGLTCPAGATSGSQTSAILKRYDDALRERGLRLSDHLIRTWLFVQNIDADYAGLVAARREFFAACGLTPQTHFVASSGIQGAAAEVAARVSLDAYAISNVRREQIRFLSAPEHLCPTHKYGVTFERGTAVAYRDRKHILLSGTASIDNQGNILHVGDVSRQLDRTLENMQALLADAGATLDDMCHFIVYVRDPSDQELAVRRMGERFASVPTVVVTAAVCRPGWLIELEGMAIVADSNPTLPAF